MRRVVNENKIGIVLNELTSESLIRALDELERFNAVELGKNLKSAATKYSWQTQERAMVNAYNKFL
jgi:hypothetical protein